MFELRPGNVAPLRLLRNMRDGNLAHRASFDHLVGASEQCRCDFEPERFCGFEIDHHLESCRLLDRKAARVFTGQDPMTYSAVARN